MAKVLLVEDDNNLREIYEARLMAEGYDIIAARDGEEALVIAKQEQPDLVISDVMMPKISGFEMLDIMRNTDALKSVKVIMLTALGQSEDQSRADSLGADRYLVKSQVTLEDIVNAAHDLLVEAGAINEPAPVATVAAPVLAAPAPLATPAPVAPIPEPVAVAAAPIIEPAVVVAPVTAPIAVAPAPSLPPTDLVSVVSAPAPIVSATPLNDVAATAPTPSVESSAVPEPVPPAPIPQPLPVAAPTPVPVMPAPVEIAAPILPETPAAQTEAEEQADVDAKIASFIDSQTGQPPLAVEPEPTASAVEVIPEAITEPVVTTTPEQEQALTDALSDLGGSEPDPTPAPVVEDDDDTPRKKVIAPLDYGDQPPKKSLEELLAAEAAAEKLITVPGQSIAPPPQAPVQAAPPVVAPPIIPTPQAAPLDDPEAEKPKSTTEFDPNSIAL